MIVVDTNVWSETVRRVPDPAVVAWMLAHRDEIALTTVTVGELLYGLEIMPAGGRQQALSSQVEQLIVGATHRTFPYDVDAARMLAQIRARRRTAGREATKPEDAMIAAIAAVHACPVATRNVNDFEGMGIEIINPWVAER